MVPSHWLAHLTVGRPDSRRLNAQGVPLCVDILELDGVDLGRESWAERRKVLVRLLLHAGYGIRLSDHLDGADGEIVYKNACAMGLEGIVAKRRDRPYRSGRSPDWIKVKNPEAPAAMRILEW